MAVRVSNLSFQVLLSPTIIERFVEQTLDFQEEPFRRKLRVSNFTFQALLLSTAQSVSVESEIAFTQDVLSILYQGDYVPAVDFISFVQDLNMFGLEVLTDPITFVDEAVGQLNSAIVQHSLGLTDSAEQYNGVPWYGPIVIDQIDFSWRANIGIPAIASSTITFTDNTFQRQAITQTITFVQTVTVGIGQTDVHHVMTLDHEISTAGSLFTRVASHANILQHSFTYYTDNPCNLKTYNQFDGEGDGDGITEPRLYSPGWKLTLETVTGPKVILQLRNPEVDDRDRIGFNRVNRETRGGEINVYSDPDWPKVNTLLFTVVALKRTKIDALQQFLYDTLGQQIKLHDWTGTTWLGVVTTPGEIATEDGVSAWTISFEFEGTPYEGMAPDVPLQFSQSVGILGIFGRTGSSDLGLVSTALGHIIVAIEEDVESILTLDHEALCDAVVEPHFAFGRVTGVGELDGEGYALPFGSGRVTGMGEIDGVGYAEHFASGEVEGVGEIDGVGYTQHSGTGEIEGIGELDGVGSIASAAFGAITGIGELDGEGVEPPVPTPQVDIYTADDTWTKPDGAVSVQVIVIGGGGGGGSGRNGETSGSQDFGGGGGAGGGLSYRFYDESELAGTEAVDVGGGGTGGATQASNPANGNSGTAGTASNFSSGGTLLTAGGGAQGLGGGTAASDTQAIGGTGTLWDGGFGGARSTTDNTRQPDNVAFWAPTGGGGGGVISATNTISEIPGTGGGSEGMALIGYSDELSDFPPLAGGAADSNGNAGVNDYSVPFGGTGGGGGSSSLTGNGTNGGNGGDYGAGGGGGGSCLPGGFTSGAGGNGAGGVVVVITYFN